MKTKKHQPPSVTPSEDDIRDYAYHLYVQNGMVPGHDLDNWLEAKACIEANIPKARSHARLHHHRSPSGNGNGGMAVIAIEAESPGFLVM